MIETTPFYVSNISAHTVKKPHKVIWAKVHLHAVRRGLKIALAVPDLSLLWLCLVITCILEITKA